MKKQTDRVYENALQVLMDHGCWIHERAWNGKKHLTKIETPGGYFQHLNDDQIINLAVELEPNKSLTA